MVESATTLAGIFLRQCLLLLPFMLFPAGLLAVILPVSVGYGGPGSLSPGHICSPFSVFSYSLIASVPPA